MKASSAVAAAAAERCVRKAWLMWGRRRRRSQRPLLASLERKSHRRRSAEAPMKEQPGDPVEVLKEVLASCRCESAGDGGFTAVVAAGEWSVQLRERWRARWSFSMRFSAAHSHHCGTRQTDSGCGACGRAISRRSCQASGARGFLYCRGRSFTLTGGKWISCSNGTTPDAALDGQNSCRLSGPLQGEHVTRAMGTYKNSQR